MRLAGSRQPSLHQLLLCLPTGPAGHPEGGAGEHGASQHAEGVGTPHIPQRYRLLDVPEDVHHPAGPDRSG